MTNKQTNKYGLTRHIPSDIARRIRQRDGFGCVVCGKAIYEYEHICPEFKDAKCHDESGIILLCREHHGLKNNFLSKKTILKYAKSPKATQSGYSFGAFDISSAHPEIIIGPLRTKNVNCIIEVDGRNLFSVSQPEEPGSPFRLNAALFDKNGKAIIEIVNNEWRTPSKNWDVEVRGPRITVRSKSGHIALRLRSEPPSRIVIERLNLAFGSTTIKAQEGRDIKITTSSGAQVVASEIDFDGQQVAIRISNNSIELGIGGGTMKILSLSATTEKPNNNTTNFLAGGK